MTYGLKLKTRILTFIVVTANVLGNFFLSLGMKAEVLGAAAADYVRVLFHPLVALGVSLLIVWLLSRMALLSWADLSYVLPVTSIGYVLNAVIGRVFLGEYVSWTRWSGTLLIVAGIVLVGSTSIRTTRPKRREQVRAAAAR